MKTPQSWGEFLEQIMVRRTSFLVSFFVVTFVTYLILYVIDFYPEPPAATESNAVAAGESTASPRSLLSSSDEADNPMLSDSIESNQSMTSNSVRVITPSTASSVNDNGGIRDNIPDNLNVTEENGEVVIDLTTPAQSGVTSVPAVAATPVLPTQIEIPALSKTVPVMNPVSRTIADLDAALLNGVVRHPDSADLANPGNVFILGHSSYLPNVLNRNFQAFNGIQKLSWGDEIKLYADSDVYTYRVDRVYEAKASEVIVPTTPGEARLTLATCDSFGSQDDRFIVEASLVRTTSA